MQNYIGTKVVKAKEMNKKEYNKYLKDTQIVPKHLSRSTQGYLIEYIHGDVAKPTNHHDHKGRIDWIPKDIFESSYDTTDNMNFEMALLFLKAGKRVTRKEWHNTGMYIALQVGSTIKSENARGGIAKCLANEGFNDIKIHPHIDMRTSDGSCVVGWTPSQIDMFSDDWLLLDEV